MLERISTLGPKQAKSSRRLQITETIEIFNEITFIHTQCGSAWLLEYKLIMPDLFVLDFCGIASRMNPYAPFWFFSKYSPLPFLPISFIVVLWPRYYFISFHGFLASMTVLATTLAPSASDPTTKRLATIGWRSKIPPTLQLKGVQFFSPIDFVFRIGKKNMLSKG